MDTIANGRCMRVANLRVQVIRSKVKVYQDSGKFPSFCAVLYPFSIWYDLEIGLAEV